MECVTYIHKHAPLATSSARRPAGARRGRDGLERRPRQLEEGGQGPAAAGPSTAATRASRSASGAPRERPRGGRGLGSVRIRARRRPCTGFTEGAPRVRSRRCFKHGGTESLTHCLPHCRTAALPLQAWRHRVSQRFRYEADGRWRRERRRGRAPDAPRPIANCRPRASAGSAPSPTLESAEAWGRRRRASAHITRIIHHEHVRASTLPSLSHCTPSYYCMGSCMTSYS